MDVTLPYRWTPRAYQLPFVRFMEEGGKRACLVWHRRTGKDLTALNICATKLAQRVGLYWHVLPTYRQGKRVVFDGMDREGRRFLDYFPGFDRFGESGSFVTRKRDDEMSLWFANGSQYQVIGAENPDSLVGPNPKGIIFSEFSVYESAKLWNLVRPILVENGGWAVFIFCVTGSTLIPTEDGLLRMDEIAEGRDVGFSPFGRRVQGLGGQHEAVQLYRAGRQRTLCFRTAKGYEIECTPGHKLWTGSAWKRAKDWKIGEKLTIAVEGGIFGTTVGWHGWTPMERRKSGSGMQVRAIPFTEANADFYYFLGLLLAEGWWSERAINIASGDPEIHEFLAKYGFNLQRDGVHSVLGSYNLCSLLSWFGLAPGAHAKIIPRTIRQLPKAMLRAFLQGYFDGDGCATLRGGVHADSVSEELIRTLQVTLLQFGIVSSRRSQWTAPTAKSRVWSKCWRVEIGGYFAGRFFDEIGFRLERKQRRACHLSERQRLHRADVVDIPVDVRERLARNLSSAAGIRRQLRRGRVAYCTLDRFCRQDEWVDKVTNDRFHWDALASIDDSESEVFDFHIPETHSCVYNGINGHQTPRGRNHGWRLLQQAQKSERWFSQVLTVDDTKIIDPEDIQAERDEGMPEHEVLQEFWCSFDAPLEGAYYGDLLMEMEKDGRICDVPWEMNFPVDTFWDLGIRDATCIWFHQKVGGQHRLIDFYYSSDVGLDHYAKVLKEKRYVYGQHLVPHDAKVREIGVRDARSRIDSARQLGLPMTIVDDIGIADGINAVRILMPKLWIDRKKCEKGVEGLKSYVRKKSETLLDPDGNALFTDTPAHSWASHPADALRMGAVGLPSETYATPKSLAPQRAIV